MESFTTEYIEYTETNQGGLANPPARRKKTIKIIMDKIISIHETGVPSHYFVPNYFDLMSAG
jgi:hypothetical protein